MVRGYDDAELRRRKNEKFQKIGECFFIFFSFAHMKKGTNNPLKSQAIDVAAAAYPGPGFPDNSQIAAEQEET